MFETLSSKRPLMKALFLIHRDDFCRKWEVIAEYL